jgi:hypothetical protein
MVLNNSFNEHEPMVCTRIGLQAVRPGVAIQSLRGSTGTGSSFGPVRWRLRAEPIRDSTEALMVQMYFSSVRVWAGYGVVWI